MKNRAGEEKKGRAGGEQLKSPLVYSLLIASSIYAPLPGRF